jgi:lauroyl/myristoyl acyltransferase
MDLLIYHMARLLVRSLQRLPIRWVAQIGRFLGGVAYVLDARHRSVAIRNLQACFGDASTEFATRTARENFRRIGENFCCAVHTSDRSTEQLREVCAFHGIEALPGLDPEGDRRSWVVAIGHFGNFELYARGADRLPGYRCATTYRGLRPPGLNRLMQELRDRSGCRFFERRTEVSALREAMSRGNMVLGLLADQHAGDHGLRLPFLGRECSVSAAPAVFALRYGCPLAVIICRRIGLARWELRLEGRIPTHENGRARTTAAIMTDVNRVFESEVRRDPANWFWVHNRWKPAPGRPSESRLRPAEVDDLAL